jgi:hypothetical protein
MADQTPTAAAEGEPDALDALDEALADDPTGAENGGEPEEWTPPTREEWEAQQAAHKAALEAEQAKRRRASEQAKKLRESKAAAAKTDGPSGAPEGPAPEIAVWQARAVRTAAKAELLARGADADMVDLAVARLKPAEIEFDADDEPELDDWLDEMQERYPKLFAPAAANAPAAPARRPGRVDQGAAAAGAPARPQMTLGEKIVAKSEQARRAGGRNRI